MSAPRWIRKPLSAPEAKVRSSAAEMSTYASVWICRRRTPMLSAYADLSHAYTRTRGPLGQDGGGRPAVDPLRRGRSRPPPVHARPWPGRRGREGRPEDDVAIRCAPRAALARRGHAPSGLRRAADRDGRAPPASASRGAGGVLPPLGRAHRRGGDAPPLLRAGGEPAGVHRVDALPRPPRRGAARGRASRARSAGALVSAEAALAVRLPAAPDELRRMRCGRCDARRLLPARGRRRVRRMRGAVRRARAQLGGDPRNGDAPCDTAGRRRRGRAERPFRTRRPAARPGVVRVPRRVPTANTLCVKRDLADGYELDDDPGRVDV